jgi:hypothetical protein
VDNFIAGWMPERSNMRKLFAKTKGYSSSKINNTFTFSELNLNRRDIAYKLIDAGVLPSSFFKAAA